MLVDTQKLAAPERFRVNSTSFAQSSLVTMMKNTPNLSGGSQLSGVNQRLESLLNAKKTKFSAYSYIILLRA